ncbi:MAG: fatty acid CoA ligase family protein [Thermodesulfobacteriota bacterium]
MSNNIYQALTRQAGERGGETALIVPKKSGGYQGWTFQEILGESRDYARGLSFLGVKKGDRVMLMVPPSRGFISLTFALFSLGAVVILIDPGMGFKNLGRSISQVNPRVFIGSPKAHIFKFFSGKSFQDTDLSLGTGLLSRILAGNPDRIKQLRRQGPGIPGVETNQDELAAVIFTTGSTGPPKGVQYTHRIFAGQLSLIRDYYDIRPGDRDQPAFPLFGLFSIGLGATVVLPQMDPSRPAKVNAAKFIKTIIEQEVSYSFGSPAIWNVVSRYCLPKKITLSSLKKVLMAGAPVSGELVARVKKILPPEAEIHTPYGATEALPVASISDYEILTETRDKTRAGQGTCVGRPLPGIEIQVIKPVSATLGFWSEAIVCPPGEIGEIVVKGKVVTRAYDGQVQETEQAKINDGNSFWHRMGDMGYFDRRGRLWFCGRKAHRVETVDRILYPIPCEAIFNEHPLVHRSALVGIGSAGNQKPVLIAEPVNGRINRKNLLKDLEKIGARNQLTADITAFLIHPCFPVDIRHNAKIFREKLAEWASNQLQIS